MRNDPNGIDWQPTWKVYGYSSFEAYVESKAGASPPDPWHYPSDEERDKRHLDESFMRPWPQSKPPPYPADDEALEHPEKQAIRKHGDRKTVDP
jgi:hypothetical protein